MHGQGTDGRGCPRGSAAPDDQAAVEITTNVRRLNALRAVALRDLLEMLEFLTPEIHEMSERADHFANPRAYDVRTHAAWVVEAIGTLDDLGWARETGWKGYRP